MKYRDEFVAIEFLQIGHSEGSGREFEFGVSCVEYSYIPVEQGDPMIKLFIFVGVFLGGWIGWWIGGQIGIWTAYVLGSIGSIIGVYFGWRVGRNLME